MKGVKRFRKVLVLWVILLFLLIGGSRNVESIINISQVKIPNNLGEIKSVYIAPDLPKNLPMKSVIIIAERHDLIQVQKNIASILENIFTHHKELHLIGLEGAYSGQRVTNPISQFPEEIRGLKRDEIKELKRDIAKGLLKNNEISAIEFIGMVSQNIKIYGVENKELYEENRRQALQQSEDEVMKEFQKAVTQVREELEKTLSGRLNQNQKEKLKSKQDEVNKRLMEYLQEVDTKGIGKLYKSLSDFQQKRITEQTFFNQYQEMCREYGINFDPMSFSQEDFEKTFSELIQKLRDTLNERIIPEQMIKITNIQEDLENYLGEIDSEIGEFNKKLKNYKAQECINDSLDFLVYIQEKCNIYGLPFPSSLKSQIEFYTTAQRRDKAIVENLLKAMGGMGESDAVLLVGGGHICGIEKEFKNKKFSFIVIIPRGMEGSFSAREEEAYRYTLQGKALPFSLFELWKGSNLLKPPPRSTMPNYGRYLAFIYKARLIYELKGKAYSNTEVRERVQNVISDNNWSLDYDGIIYNQGDLYIPCEIHHTSGILRLSKYSKDARNEPVYPVLKHGHIGKLFYEFIDEEHFNKNPGELIHKNNEGNIASSPLKSAIVEIIFMGKDSEGRW